MNPFFILTQIFFSLVAFSTSDYSLYVTHNLHVLNEVYVTPAAENLHAACRTIEGYSQSIVHYLKDLSASSSSHPTAPTSAGSNDSTPNSTETEAKSNDEQLVTNDIMIFTTLEPRNTRCGVIRAEIDISEAAASPGKPFFSVRKKGRLTTFRYECRTVPSAPSPFPFHARDVSSDAILVDAHPVEVPETPTLLPSIIATQGAQHITEGQPVITSPPLAFQAMPVRLAAPAPHIIIAIAVFLACLLTLAVHRKSRLAKARENVPLLPFTTPSASVVSLAAIAELGGWRGLAKDVSVNTGRLDDQIEQPLQNRHWPWAGALSPPFYQPAVVQIEPGDIAFMNDSETESSLKSPELEYVLANLGEDNENESSLTHIAEIDTDSCTVIKSEPMCAHATASDSKRSNDESNESTLRDEFARRRCNEVKQLCEYQFDFDIHGNGYARTNKPMRTFVASTASTAAILMDATLTSPGPAPALGLTSASPSVLRFSRSSSSGKAKRARALKRAFEPARAFLRELETRPRKPVTLVRFDSKISTKQKAHKSSFDSDVTLKCLFNPMRSFLNELEVRKQRTPTRAVVGAVVNHACELLEAPVSASLPSFLPVEGLRARTRVKRKPPPIYSPDLSVHIVEPHDECLKIMDSHEEDRTVPMASMDSFTGGDSEVLGSARALTGLEPWRAHVIGLIKELSEGMQEDNVIEKIDTLNTDLSISATIGEAPLADNLQGDEVIERIDTFIADFSTSATIGEVSFLADDVRKPARFRVKSPEANTDFAADLSVTAVIGDTSFLDDNVERSPRQRAANDSGVIKSKLSAARARVRAERLTFLGTENSGGNQLDRSARNANLLAVASVDSGSFFADVDNVLAVPAKVRPLLQLESCARNWSSERERRDVVVVSGGLDASGSASGGAVNCSTSAAHSIISNISVVTINKAFKDDNSECARKKALTRARTRTRSAPARAENPAEHTDIFYAGNSTLTGSMFAMTSAHIGSSAISQTLESSIVDYNESLALHGAGGTTVGANASSSRPELTGLEVCTTNGSNDNSILVTSGSQDGTNFLEWHLPATDDWSIFSEGVEFGLCVESNEDDVDTSRTSWLIPGSIENSCIGFPVDERLLEDEKVEDTEALSTTAALGLVSDLVLAKKSLDNECSNVDVESGSDAANVENKQGGHEETSILDVCANGEEIGGSVSDASSRSCISSLLASADAGIENDGLVQKQELGVDTNVLSSSNFWSTDALLDDTLDGLYRVSGNLDCVEVEVDALEGTLGEIEEVLMQLMDALVEDVVAQATSVYQGREEPPKTFGEASTSTSSLMRMVMYEDDFTTVDSPVCGDLIELTPTFSFEMKTTEGDLIELEEDLANAPTYLNASTSTSALEPERPVSRMFIDASTSIMALADDEEESVRRFIDTSTSTMGLTEVTIGGVSDLREYLDASTSISTFEQTQNDSNADLSSDADSGLDIAAATLLPTSNSDEDFDLSRSAGLYCSTGYSAMGSSTGDHATAQLLEDSLPMPSLILPLKGDGKSRTPDFVNGLSASDDLVDSSGASLQEEQDAIVSNKSLAALKYCSNVPDAISTDGEEVSPTSVGLGTSSGEEVNEPSTRIESQTLVDSPNDLFSVALQPVNDGQKTDFRPSQAPTATSAALKPPPAGGRVLDMVAFFQQREQILTSSSHGARASSVRARIETASSPLTAVDSPGPSGPGSSRMTATPDRGTFVNLRQHLETPRLNLGLSHEGTPGLDFDTPGPSALRSVETPAPSTPCNDLPVPSTFAFYYGDGKVIRPRNCRNMTEEVAEARTLGKNAIELFPEVAQRILHKVKAKHVVNGTGRDAYT